MAEGNYDDAIRPLSQELKSKAGLAQKKYALAQLRVCFDQAKRTDFAYFLTVQVRPALLKTDELYVETLELEGISLREAKQYAKAAGVVETIKTNYSDRPETYKHALFNLVMLYGGELADNANATENLDELKARYPGDKLTWHAAALFGEQIMAPEQGRVGTEEAAPTPEGTALLSSYPNPFNPTTTLRYALRDGGNVSLVVYDVVGRQVAALASGYQGPGYHAAQWMASSVASGVYFARLIVTDDLGRIVYRKTNKLLLAK